MRKTLLITGLIASISGLAQEKSATNPAVNAWLFNLDGSTARHYVSGDSTPINDSYEVNVQSSAYNNNYSYVSASGLPSYIIGPYLDGNPSQAIDNDHIFKIPLIPQENTGSLTSTPFGAIGVFINGVPMYDYKDGVSWSNSSNQEAGGPLGGSGDGVWNRDAVLAEREGFDCSKGHPSPNGGPGGGGPGGSVDGTYHHHQNPTAFDLDMVTVSNVCDLYASDGMFVLDSTQHSPLLGFSFDGFPVYGAYGYANSDGSGGIKLIKSSYQLRNISVRTHYADGTDVTDGPAVSNTYPLGQYREDYEFNASFGDLDEHNGRFCVTPEYPNGIYCYFATVDDNWNSTYPYLVGPEYYGVVDGGEVTSIPGNTTSYDPALSSSSIDYEVEVDIYPNPSSDYFAVQVNKSMQSHAVVELYNINGKLIESKQITKGSTMAFFNVENLPNGNYIVNINCNDFTINKKVVIKH